MWCKVKEQNKILKKYTTSTRKVTDRKRMRKESKIKQKSKSSKHKEQKNSIDRVTIQQLKCLRSLWLESCHTSCHVTTLGNIGHVYTCPVSLHSYAWLPRPTQPSIPLWLTRDYQLWLRIGKWIQLFPITDKHLGGRKAYIFC